MSNETILYLGGIYNVILIIFHLSFWKIFKWEKELKRMNFLNGNVYQILNISLTFAFVIFAYLSFFYNNELLSTPLGIITLKLIAFFWFFRALQQIYFFGIKDKISFLFFIGFLMGALFYILPTF
ncbi:MAG: hypothetical protein H6609_09260 [Ignavibacteriales bacterium]|nr:hypothetical protein [Ignavibacteriales bacterium]